MNVLPKRTMSSMPVSSTWRRVMRETDRSLSIGEVSSRSGKDAIIRRFSVRTLKYLGALAQVARKVSNSSGGRHSRRARLPVGSMPTR